jgi:hypothetical protein
MAFYVSHAGQFSSGLAKCWRICSEDTNTANMNLEGNLFQQRIIHYFSVALRALLHTSVLQLGSSTTYIVHTSKFSGDT